MPAWNVQRVEVVQLGFDLLPLHDLIPERFVDRGEVVDDAGQQVKAARLKPRAGQGDIQCLARESRRQRRVFQRGFACIKQRLEFVF